MFITVVMVDEKVDSKVTVNLSSFNRPSVQQQAVPPLYWGSPNLNSSVNNEADSVVVSAFPLERDFVLYQMHRKQLSVMV